MSVESLPLQSYVSKNKLLELNANLVQVVNQKVLKSLKDHIVINLHSRDNVNFTCKLNHVLATFNFILHD